MKTLNLALLGCLVAIAGCGARRPLGSPCNKNRDCASRLVCNYGVCAKGNCQPAGGKCSTNDDCCGSLFCSGKTCH